MKYFLVALFDDGSNSIIQNIQRDICRKYKLYKSSPNLYISICTITNPDLEKLDVVVSKIMVPYKKFKVNINNNISLTENFTQVNLKVEDKGYIYRLARSITNTLDLHGFNVKSENDNIDLRILIANANHIIKKSCTGGSITIDANLEKDDFYKFAKVCKLELWKQISNKKEMIVKTYDLREY
ncbi:hypothetical protein G9F72_025510 [Clostridium estertheticum]|uniref:hypothetical protein n=1 Tax=Clostridium estertheticum TaxID=238834 RepID=UPI0013E91B41|nr:hypothetical protein [Clostridium estertheticum]MBZ9689638.1 hypothetical protein [Clostridium estertheticum]